MEIQFSVFQNDMERYFDQLAIMGVNLSEDMGSLVDRQLASQEMTFDQLNDSPEVLNALEEEMIEPLCRTLRQSSCSGAFVLLDSTVNTRMEGAGHSRAGLYDDPKRHPAVPVLYADRAVQHARHLRGGAAVFASPAGTGRHDVRAVRL